MEQLFSDGVLNTPSSFIREILKVTQSDDIISFAGGLPNPISFPADALKESSDRVIHDFQGKVFQYSTTEGYDPLREYIAKRYEEKFELSYDKNDILITTGSQQALDLLGKVLINKGDRLAIERPGYLGAIQSFSMYQPSFVGIDLKDNGLDAAMLKTELEKGPIKLLYTVPNFQNPTGLTYSKESREQVCNILQDYNTVLIEDDPYGDLRFDGENLPYIGAGKLPNSVLLGSISKIITPGFRLGWICTKNRELMHQLVIAKQASDLHSNIFSQYVIYDYLSHHDLTEHIVKIRQLYKEQSSAMLAAIQKYFPSTIKYTVPQGGMFLWATLPDGQSALELFQKASKKKVAFVPGDPFYVGEKNVPSFRLNYTNSDSDTIFEGIKRIAQAIEDLLSP
ncbi:aminotransferase-like domain-containing protein [Konateibacter massiliensis]|uniref:aminotransferase-like domain-containing protein n=1 Tax=Konateibacter massiliensis TaxID=2002841 RepID=UPI000C1561D7|nr:PLP-dependent aminotransferase family protein [Konateibacter massiliensis]